MKQSIKKTSTKSTKSPAPATKSAPPVKSTAQPVAKTKTAAPFAKTAAPFAAVKPVEAKRVATTITALVDVGFGNGLYIRGEGPGLSWDQGVRLDCLSDDKWSIALGESARPVVFKFLVNDTSWSAGEDYTVAPGTSITVTPVF
jgi:hypothetical protein